MRQHSFISVLFFILSMVVGSTLALAETTSTTTVELPTAIHFLTPAGDDIEVGPGIYEVEAAESWLKLVPEGESRSTALLLEANRGPHEEDVTAPSVRTSSSPNTPEVLHVALLLPDGIGMEAVGTVTGIRPRALNFAFVGRTRQAKSFTAGPKITLPGPVGQTQAPAPRPKGQPVDCGPYQKVISAWGGGHAPALEVFKKSLHLVASQFNKAPRWMLYSRDRQQRLPLKHWVYSNGKWDDGKEINGQVSNAGVALASFQNRLHMVHLGESSNDLWYSTFNGQIWTPNVKIVGQKSKATPALAVLNNQLHMVHLGDSSDALWHSKNNGNGWTVNVRIPLRSDQPPALGRVPNGPLAGRLHMVVKKAYSAHEPESLWHSQYDGRQWRRAVRIPGALTKESPTLVSGYPDQLHLIHLGKSSDNLWHMLYGPNKTKNNSVEWFDERRLLAEESKTPVAVALFQGCYHMVSIKGDNLMHTTFSTPQIHPTVR